MEKYHGDKRCLDKDLFDKLFIDGIHLVTKLRENMKRKAINFMDKTYFRKIAIIESVKRCVKKTLTKQLNAIVRFSS